MSMQHLGSDDGIRMGTFTHGIHGFHISLGDVHELLLYEWVIYIYIYILKIRFFDAFFVFFGVSC